MLRRLEKNEESLEEHELLEIMLFNAVPRKNTNPAAHELIRAFGSLEGVLRASFEQLRTVNGIGAETAHRGNLERTRQVLGTDLPGRLEPRIV